MPESVIKTGRLLRQAELMGAPPDKIRSKIHTNPLDMLEEIDMMFPNAGDSIYLLVTEGHVSHLEQIVRTDDLIPIPVYVASESEIKREAVSDGLGGAEVKMVVSESGIDKQPMGMEMIRTGVKNRMKSALKNGARGRVYAIENGLIKKKGKYFDVGMVLLLDTNTGNYAMALTEEIGVPINIVKTMIRRGVEKTTWGMVLAEKYPDRVDHQDPHHFITGGEYSRKILIKEAVQKVERILETHKR